MKTPKLFLSLCIQLLLLFGNMIANAQEEGLKGQILEQEKTRKNPFEHIFGKEGENTNALSVTVVEDSEDRLTLELDYTGFKSGNMSIAVKDKFKREQRFIPKQEFSLKGKSSPLEVTLNLGKSASMYSTRESFYLEVKVIERRVGFLPRSKTFLYKLRKKWKRKADPGKKTVPVKLTPMGDAANLEESDKALLKPEFKPIPPHPMDGTWINADENTKSIGKIIISGRARNIRTYKNCDAKDCDPKTKGLSRTGTSGTCNVTFSDTKSVSYLTLSLLNEDLKVIQKKLDIKEKKWETTEAVFIKQPPQPQGPDNKPISLWGSIKADANFEFPHEISNIRTDIYPDRNPQSGIFYYLPGAYHLRWNPKDGYQFKMLYGTADDDALSGNIRMTGVITPGIGNIETDLIKTLLQAYIQNNSGYTYKELKIMPLKASPDISLSGLNGQYNIPPEKISIGVHSTINAPIDVSWVTDNRTRDEMQVALSEGVGVHGTMTLTPSSENVPTQEIPVRITLADVRTLGRFTLRSETWRTKKWKNPTPYPLKLKFIHALVIKKEVDKHKPLVNSWSLDDKEIPPKAGVKFNTAAMPEWLDKENKAERIWIDYTIADCPPCVNKVMDKLTGGTSGSKAKKIALESFNVLETLNANKLSIRIRSKQVDPKGYNRVELPTVHIEEDSTPYSAGPLYLPEGEDIKYEYFFTLVMGDGKTYRSDEWISSRQPEMYIGIQTLKDAMSSIDAILD